MTTMNFIEFDRLIKYFKSQYELLDSLNRALQHSTKESQLIDVLKERALLIDTAPFSLDELKKEVRKNKASLNHKEFSEYRVYLNKEVKDLKKLLFNSSLMPNSSPQNMDWPTTYNPYPPEQLDNPNRKYSINDQEVTKEEFDNERARINEAYLELKSEEDLISEPPPKFIDPNNPFCFDAHDQFEIFFQRKFRIFFKQHEWFFLLLVEETDLERFSQGKHNIDDAGEEEQWDEKEIHKKGRAKNLTCFLHELGIVDHLISKGFTKVETSRILGFIIQENASAIKGYINDPNFNNVVTNGKNSPYSINALTFCIDAIKDLKLNYDTKTLEDKKEQLLSASTLRENRKGRKK